MAKATAEILDDAIDLHERRKSERAELLVRVNYQSVDELFSEFARNINEGGLFVETESPHPVGTAVTLQFQIPGSEEPVQVAGNVVRATDAVSGDTPGMGIEFDGLGSTDQRRVNDLVRNLRALRSS